ncbi:ABC superfamily ATP binding cassette transporter, membrane protein [Limosilactobacillus gastricus PS3]|uniref:Putative hemin transport system permease protein HrtB n=1 Tax=Limosilactobacillus gastricus PS3 TaxID=1144300 RepID=H4GJR3_9LACO|nr:ABC transporter permease [Limosilactobacillus gastricus]EHS86213.1 ABC superfamily ATP binding cassette transporter, membrane protein [Limosilactobacillus gastricus PS3]
MFLALHEMKHEKLRYGMVIFMIMLISYLVFVLAALALGLANQEYQALDTWNVKSAVMTTTSDKELRQSTLTPQQVKKLTKNQDNAVVAINSVIAKASGKKQVASTFVGIDKDQFIYHDLKLTSGHKPTNSHQVVVNESYQNDGYKLGDQIKLGSDQTKYRIVGFAKNSMLQIAPVIYGTVSTWQQIRRTGDLFAGSAVVSKKSSIKVNESGLKSYPIQQVIEKLPGYSAQNMTFEFMIGFLLIISLIVIAVFLYIITIQKLSNYAVLRAQGVPSRFLVNATIAQSILLTVSGLVIAVLLVWGTSLLMPAAVPMSFNWGLVGAISLGLVVMSLLGSIIPVRVVTKVDPVSVIGG